MRDVIFIANLDRTIIDANQPALREIFGYELGEVTGKNSRMLYADDDAYNLSGREFFNQKGYVKEKIIEVAARRKSGEIFSGEILLSSFSMNMGTQRQISPS
jgi:PAS domain S-box-containing protein